MQYCQVFDEKSPRQNLSRLERRGKLVMRETSCCQTDIIEAFNSTSRYLDGLFNIDNPYFEQMVLLNFSLIRRILLIVMLRYLT